MKMRKMVCVVCVLALGAAGEVCEARLGTGDRKSKELEVLREDLERRESGGRDHFVAQTRQKAVQSLAGIGSPEAWELVVSALEDPSPRVADEAQLVLGGVGDVDGLAVVLGRDGLRSREPLVRARVAEALGRLSSSVGEGADELLQSAFAKSLDDRDAEVRRMLLWSLERLARGRRLKDRDGKLSKICARIARKDRADAVRGGALRALAALDGERALDQLTDALEDKRAIVRAAALDGLARQRSRKCATIAAMGADPAPLVRRAAVENLARMGSKEALAALIERLEPEQRPRLQRLVRDTLQRMTGMLFKDDPRPWRVYLERLPADWRAGAARRPPERDTRAPALFAGLPVHSDRVAFLIDFSGSIWMEQEDGRTRKEQVDVELEKALRALPPSTRFNIIPYSNEPHPWRAELVEAKSRNVEKAIDWFAECKLDGKGNLYDAVLVALEDPEVDTIVLLTDGAPTGGQRWNVDLMAQLLLERNRAHGVAFDAVLVGVHGKLLASWERFCAATRGTSVVVDW